MLLYVVIEVVESLDLVQILDGYGDLVGHLHEGYQVHQIDAIQLQGFFQGCFGSEFALFDFKLFRQQAVKSKLPAYICDSFY